MNFQNYWEGQSSSGHRFSQTSWFAKKAMEHSQIIGDDASLPTVDLGCGAGELLEHLVKRVNVSVALDYSQSMLEAAKKRLGVTSIEFTNQEVFQYLGQTNIPIWIACESTNQYLDCQDQKKLMQLFRRNVHARSMYLFDTVCPVRYLLRNRANLLDFSAGKEFTWLRSVYGFSKGLSISLLGPRNLEILNIGEMGYAFSPGFFLRLARSEGLNVEVVNSRFYEYRYHVIIHKPSVQ